MAISHQLDTPVGLSGAEKTSAYPSDRTDRPGPLTASKDNLIDHVRFLDTGQPLVETLGSKCQAAMIDSELV